ncbi:GNAT family N-acetyltransferase [Aestuariimicrobium ganziense]|uniref:GNAT family N-acetyltransferase n=1 Tax=Aestuariimicrobium ganziense TaxID=2773677 RepID=UPI001944A1AE|nr:GNAT family N-acetyltransferase [Aestuariimicrobium ganziense]
MSVFATVVDGFWAARSAEFGQHEAPGADCIFHYDLATGAQVRAQADPSEVRALTEDDRAAFDEFQSRASADDLDAAFVELDHWAVVGAFHDGQLVAAASAYPWRDSPLADIGVLVLPDHRGHGHARTVVHALSREIWRRDHEPLYRCQVDHVASRGVARSSGLTLLGYWTPPSED